jgi:hypothetical protein
MKFIIAVILLAISPGAVLTAGEVEDASFERQVVPLLAKHAPNSLQVLAVTLDVSDNGSVISWIRESRSDTGHTYTFRAKPKGSSGTYNLDLSVTVPWMLSKGIIVQLTERPSQHLAKE